MAWKNSSSTVDVTDVRRARDMRIIAGRARVESAEAAEMLKERGNYAEAARVEASGIEAASSLEIYRVEYGLEKRDR